MDNKLIVVAYAIIKQGSNIILTREKDRDGWKLPGGWVEWGESFEQAVTREISEEIGGKNVIFENLVGIWQHFGDEDHRIFIVLAGSVDEKQNFKANLSEIEKIDFIDINNPDLRKYSSFYKARYFQAVQNYLEGKVFPIEMVRNFTRSQQ